MLYTPERNVGYRLQDLRHSSGGHPRGWLHPYQTITPLKMHKTVVCFSFAVAALTGTIIAKPIQLDFGQTPVASPYLTLSPGHVSGSISGTTWNTISTSANRTDLLYDDGTAAAGITLDLGQEDAGGGSNVINFANDIGNLNLVGTGGGTAGQQVLVGNAGSIYGSGNVAANTAPGRDGIFGGGTATGTGVAIGLRIDGLAVGDYTIYIMARNTNSNSTASSSMNVYAAAGDFSSSFDFGLLTPVFQGNTNYNNTNPLAYNTFVENENYVTLNVTVGGGESVYVAVDGANLAVDRRGFIESLQIVPEPSAVALSVVGMTLSAGLRRRRK